MKLPETIFELFTYWPNEVRAKCSIHPSPSSADPPIKRGTVGRVVDIWTEDELLMVDFDGQIELCMPNELTILSWQM